MRTSSRRSTRGSAVITDSTFCTSDGVPASPMRRLRISLARTIAMTTSRTPMPMLPIASKRGSSVTFDSTTPTSAMTRPISAPTSSSSTTGKLGALGPADELDPRRAAAPSPALASRTAVRSDMPSNTTATRRIATAMPRDSTSCGCRSLSTPSYSAKRPPAVKSTTDTTKAQK